MEEILHQAEQLEKEYDWFGAVGAYERALNLLPPNDFSSKGEIHECLGHAFYRFAFQADSKEAFRERLHEAILAYAKAKELHGRSNESVKKSRILHCAAMAMYMSYWLASETRERKRLLDESCRFEKEAIRVCNETTDRADLGEACINLAEYLADRLELEPDTETREKMLDEALSSGQKAIQILASIGNEDELARAYCITGINCYTAAMSSGLEVKRRECEKETFHCAKEAIRISEDLGDKFLLGRSTLCLAWAECDIGAGTKVAIGLFKKALQNSIETKDHRRLSETFDGLAFSTEFGMTLEESLEKRRERSVKSEEYAGKAVNYSIPADYVQGIPHSYSYGYVANLVGLARREIEFETRHELLKRATTLGKQGLEKAQLSGSTHAIFHVSCELAHALYHLSTVETDVEKKRELLVEATTLGEEAIRYTEQLRPHYTLPQSLPYETLALTLYDLGRLEERADKGKVFLEKSISRMETCIALLRRHIASFPSRRELFAMLASFQTELGSILNQLYQTTGEKETMRKLIETYGSAAEMNSKADLPSRVAETYWQIAVGYDHLGEYSESSSSFESASEQYEQSTRNIPQLNSYYKDYAAYMHAWSDIEKARHTHESEEFDRAKESYEKAASILKSSKSWKYLAPNFSAWAYLEEAENLSRNDESEEAIHAFTKAAQLFSQAKISIEQESQKILSLDERDIAARLSEVSDLRKDYCFARILLEDARNLYTSGDCVKSAEKYESAAKKLEKIAHSMENETERKELLSLVYMCQAWQKMSSAEEMVEADLYAKASELFSKAKESSSKKRTAMLAAGNSCICRALELGAKYRSTKNMIFYSEAKHYMESASDYYMDAGFGKASTWVSATEALFDSYFYMGKAETEVNHVDKTKFYGLAEAYLDRAAGQFKKAGYTKKTDDVLKTLERVKEKREFAMSLDKVLVAPSITSSTANISVPTASHEEAAGLQRFEHSNVQANLIISVSEVMVGEDMDLGLELVNTGKGQALLIKVEAIIPEEFEVKEAPESYRIEDSYLNMKGKQLSPLGTEEVKLVLRPQMKGVFTLKPRILYVDETGKYKSHEPEPVVITVRELGIKGWLKGER